MGRNPRTPQPHHDQPWPLHDVLLKLADAADHLLRDHNCDQQGWELVGRARDEARKIVKGRDMSVICPECTGHSGQHAIGCLRTPAEDRSHEAEKGVMPSEPEHQAGDSVAAGVTHPAENTSPPASSVLRALLEIKALLDESEPYNVDIRERLKPLLAALLREAEAEQQRLLLVLTAVRPIVAANAEASHFTDGFEIGPDGLPRGRPRGKTKADRILSDLDSALAGLLLHSEERIG